MRCVPAVCVTSKSLTTFITCQKETCMSATKIMRQNISTLAIAGSSPLDVSMVGSGQNRDTARRNSCRTSLMKPLLNNGQESFKLGL